MLTGKIALVTGAGRGIGAEIARTFAREGAAVIINYNGSKERAEKVAAEIIAAGGKAETYQCNVADDAACKEMIDTCIKSYGRIDILVNNAGITRDDLLMRMSEEDFDIVMDTNLKGTFHTIRHMSRYFLKQKSGKIINMSSVSGILGNAGQANYSASKAGVIGLTKSVARELASRRINVNAIAKTACFIFAIVIVLMLSNSRFLFKTSLMGLVRFEKSAAKSVFILWRTGSKLSSGGSACKIRIRRPCYGW